MRRRPPEFPQKQNDSYPGSLLAFFQVGRVSLGNPPIRWEEQRRTTVQRWTTVLFFYGFSYSAPSREQRDSPSISQTVFTIFHFKFVNGSKNLHFLFLFFQSLHNFHRPFFCSRFFPVHLPSFDFPVGLPQVSVFALFLLYAHQKRSFQKKYVEFPTQHQHRHAAVCPEHQKDQGAQTSVEQIFFRIKPSQVKGQKR